MNIVMYRASPLVVLVTTLLMASLLFFAAPARAVLTIEIVGSGANQIPIAIAPFRAEQGLPTQLTSVITADLARSGLFKSVDAGGVVPVPHEPDQIN